MVYILVVTNTICFLALVYTLHRKSILEVTLDIYYAENRHICRENCRLHERVQQLELQSAEEEDAADWWKNGSESPFEDWRSD